MLRVKRLLNGQWFHDWMWWLIVPRYIQKIVENNGLANAEGLF